MPIGETIGKKIPCLVVGGPTASGKSALALTLACKKGGEIINADSMQMYTHLSILTARPSAADLEQVPHHLYGVLSGQVGEISSVVWWLHQVVDFIKDAYQRGKLPIIVGGTGLYLKALLQGISDMPDIPQAIRQRVRSRAEESTSDNFYQWVCQLDPRIEGDLKPGDRQRLTRAAEVFLATGQSIRSFQGHAQPLLPLDPAITLLKPERAALYARIDQRFLNMIEQGAIEEVQRLLALDLPKESPVLKAVGVPELTAYLQGDLSKEEAISKAQQRTRNYAKRQMTWFSNQFDKGYTTRF